MLQYTLSQGSPFLLVSVAMRSPLMALSPPSVAAQSVPSRSTSKVRNRAPAQTLRGCIRGTDLTIFEMKHTTTGPESEPNAAPPMISEQIDRVLLNSKSRPGDVLDDATIRQVQKSVLLGDPQVPRVIPRHDMRCSAGHFPYRNEPAVLPIGKSVSR